MRPTFFVGMDGANVPFEMFAPDKTLSTPVGMAGIGPHALFCLVPAGGVDGLTVGGGDFAPAGLFGEVGNRDGDFGYGAGCAAGGADGMGVDEGGGVDGGGGGHKLGVGGVGEVEAVAGDVVGRGVAGGAEGEVREVHGGLGRAVGEEGEGVGEGVGGGEDVEGGVDVPLEGLPVRGIGLVHGELAAEHPLNVGHGGGQKDIPSRPAYKRAGLYWVAG